MVFLYPNLFRSIRTHIKRKSIVCSILILTIATPLSACSSKEKENKAVQTLVKVNGEEITVLQLNHEISLNRIQPNQQEAVTKKLLESMIDQQLVFAEAVRNKVDRSPEVMQAIERAKKQLIAQAYLRGITAKITKPSKAEINDYFQKHPELFAQRRDLHMKALTISSSDMSSDLKSFMDSAKSLDDVATWLGKHNIQYLKGHGTRNTASLPSEMALKLQSSPKGTLFIVNEGDKSMLVSLDDIKDSPVTISDAEPQIERYLIEKKIKEAIDAEVTHLRSQAKIEYVGASAPLATGTPKTETKPAETSKGGS